jgi:hypothetical protein
MKGEKDVRVQLDDWDRQYRIQFLDEYKQQLLNALAYARQSSPLCRAVDVQGLDDSRRMAPLPFHLRSQVQADRSPRIRWIYPDSANSQKHDTDP